VPASLQAPFVREPSREAACRAGGLLDPDLFVLAGAGAEAIA
jgi:hypothetical protein